MESREQITHTVAEGWRFIAVNDLHYAEAACRPWFDQVVAAMKKDAPDAKFCLIVGDLSDTGQLAQLQGVKEAFAALDVPVFVTPGNHDYATNDDSKAYDQTFPGQRNQHFEVEGWQFIGLDSVYGTRWENTSIQSPTFEWLDENLPQLSRTKPTVIWTHFPLAEAEKYHPHNSDSLLERFLDFNVQGILNGHWHAFTQHDWNSTLITTNRCCSRVRDNHDGSTEKGWFVCEVKDGAMTRRFVEIPVIEA